MAKKIKIVADLSKLSPKFGFSIGDEFVKVDENISIEHAELIAAQFPGQYVEVIDEPEAPTKTAKVLEAAKAV